jgi:pyruvate kinase
MSMDRALESLPPRSRIEAHGAIRRPEEDTMALLELDHPRGDRAFQIVATLGPASLHLPRELAAAGATSFRLNASHLSVSQLETALAVIRGAVPGAPVVVDLQGAKMRLGLFRERPVSAGDRVIFTLKASPEPRAPISLKPVVRPRRTEARPSARGASSSSAGSGNASSAATRPPVAARGSAAAAGRRADWRLNLPLPHPELFAALRPGDTLTADDDRLRFRIERSDGERAEARVLVGGVLRPRKGVNLLEHPVDRSDLSATDAAFVAAAHPGAAFAFSFMRDGAEAAWLRSRAPGALVIGKIERREATEALAAIAAAVDALWICRGDLGAQLGIGAMARFVSHVDPPMLPRPVLMAGQVLEHLTHHAAPTRSEACHLFDLVVRGFAGIVLSDETAIGTDPVRAVAAAAALVHDAVS